MKLRVIVASLSVAALLWACGNQAFLVRSTTQNQPGPGFYQIPPKVDILLAEDNTGSILSAFSTITAQFPVFLNQLDQQGWDFLFATTPLTHSEAKPLRNLGQIISSKYDGNWALNGRNQWKPPFPGATPTPIIPANIFREPSFYTEFMTLNDVDLTLNRKEPGFETIKQFINTKTGGTGFPRSDAQLFVLVLGNGNDTSGVRFCRRWDGWVAPCELINPSLGTAAASFAQYKADFLSWATGGITTKTRMFSAVAHNYSTNCLGSISFRGERYINMASELEGGTINICANSISSMLSQFGQFLQGIRQAFRTRFIVLGQEPQVPTISIIKYTSANPGGVMLANSASNGWTYKGQSTEFLIDHPIPMNQATGFMIELHGSAKLLGNDRVVINYTPVGQSGSG